MKGRIDTNDSTLRSRGRRLLENRLVDQAIRSPASTPRVTEITGRATWQIQQAEIISLDNVNQRLVCRYPGSDATQDYDVELPRIFTQSSREGVTFTYSDLNTREADDGNETETQEITPRFIVGEIIKVCYLVSEDVYEFVGDGRMWAKTG